MVTSLLIGALLGVLAGLGIGGGSLLMLWLTLVEDTEPLTARGINLMFFIASAGAACLTGKRKDKPPAETPAVITGCISAAIFNYVALCMDADKLKPLFGILLLIIGAREIFYRPRNAR